MAIGHDAQWLAIALLQFLALITWAGLAVYRRRTPSHTDSAPPSRTRRSSDGVAHGDGPWTRPAARRLGPVALLAVASLAGSVLPAAATGGPQDAASSLPSTSPVSAVVPAPPQTLPSLAASRDLFQGLVTSVAPPASSNLASTRADWTTFIGWGISVAGILARFYSGDQTAAQFAAISQELSQIQQTVDQIESEVTALQTRLQQLSEQLANADCAIQTDAASGPLAVIQSAAQDYGELQRQAIAAGQPGSTEAAPTWTQILGWAQEYTSGPDSLQQAIDEIEDVVGGTVDAGSLQACALALIPSGGQAALEWEAAYYANLYLYVSYWYQVQVQALNLFVEAQHVVALANTGQDAAQPPSPSDAAQVCTPPVANGVVQAACNSAQDMVSLVYSSVSQQLVQAGAAYGWGTGGLVVAASPWDEGQAGAQYAWLLDINDFQASGCTLPLTSTGTPCGGSVGTDGQFDDDEWGGFSWGSYTGWMPAPTSAWLSLGFNSDGPWQVWQSLAGVGLGDPAWGGGRGLQDLIIYTGETTTSTQDILFEHAFQNTVVGQCLIDSSWWMQSSWGGVLYPYCDDRGGGNLSTLVANYTQPDQGGVLTQFPPAYPGNPFEYSNDSFYDAAFGLDILASGPWVRQTAPGWLTRTTVSVLGSGGTSEWGTYTQSARPQYRWPVLPLTNQMCTVPSGGPAAATGSSTMTILNSGGAPTMCGPDMAAWLAEQLPTAPAPAAPLAVTSQHALGSADVSWTPGSGIAGGAGYRILGMRGSGSWTTLATTRPPADERARTATRLHRRVSVPAAGNWRFRVVALHGRLRSQPSTGSRTEYIPAERLRSRYYTFRDDAGTIRVATAFADGRVYWNGPSRSGVGRRHGSRILGHTFTDPYGWSGRWAQRARGPWDDLQWRDWRRVHGPSPTRRGMPLAQSYLPRY